jgi:outer membrane beta-barrel protein
LLSGEGRLDSTLTVFNLEEFFVMQLHRKIFGLIALTWIILCPMAKASGLALDPDELRGTSSKKPISVLQNRFYLKAWRPELGLLYGTITNEAYTDTKLHGYRLGIFLNEWVGVETQYILSTVRDSADRKALKKKVYRDQFENKLVTADAEVNPIRQLQDFVAVAAPLYGKVNVLDMFLVYVDIYATLGISRVNTQQGVKTAIAVGGGQRFYWADQWNLRLDFRNRSYTETRAGNQSRRNAWSVDFGLGYLFL